VTRRPIKPVLCLSILLLIGCAWGDDGFDLQELQKELDATSLGQPAPRDLAQTVKSDILPKLHLEGKAVRSAIEDLGRLGFQCTLAPEQRNLLDRSKPMEPFVVCERLLTTGDGKIYGGVRTHVFMSDWKGDGTSPASRYEQLMTARVAQTLVSGLPYADQRDANAEKNVSSALDQALVIATPHQPMSDVVKHAMTHEILCRATTAAGNHREALECSTFQATPGCNHALIRIEVSGAEGATQPLSIWSTDRMVKGKQGPWICLSTIR